MTTADPNLPTKPSQQGASMPTVALVGSLDTKAREYGFVREQIEAAGCSALIIDVGVLGEPGLNADVSREQVAFRAGVSLEELRDTKERGRSVVAMANGASDIVAELAARAQISSVLAVGGSNAAYVMARIAEALHIGVPKVLVSTMASGDTRPYVGVTDLMMMNPVVDINGLNRVTRPVLANAARAAAALSADRPPPAAADRPAVALSMFGVTTACATRLGEVLDGSDLEPLSFHANGAGGRALEALVAARQLQAVVDMTTTELADELLGGVCTAGPDRLRAAGRHGIPQVISLGALDMVNFGPRESVPEPYRERTLYEHNPEVTLMRTNEDECAALGKMLADRLNNAMGTRAVVIPTRGFSMISVSDGPFHFPSADAALIDSLTADLDSSVEVHRLDTDINDPPVAELMGALVANQLQESNS